MTFTAYLTTLLVELRDSLIQWADGIDWLNEARLLATVTALVGVL